ncbi:hypothetical protein [Desulfosediminicola ganghwensis]|uniref:hypothetical protein n=1 Tax=Desulfosediminicola ganghwensis TaxID=2569540 RepID=UPI0010AD2AA8|nr:hypothetical protein [Desulfosediminicola ganghwensis]
MEHKGNCRPRDARINASEQLGVFDYIGSVLHTIIPGGGRLSGRGFHHTHQGKLPESFSCDKVPGNIE